MGAVALGWTALALTAAGTAYQIDRSKKDRRQAEQASANMEKKQNEQVDIINQQNAQVKKEKDEENAKADAVKLRNSQRDNRSSSSKWVAATSGGRAGTILTGPLGIPSGQAESGKRKTILGG